MKNITPEITLRSDTPGYEHRSWKVVRTGWAKEGQTCVTQNNVSLMESKPSVTQVYYLIQFGEETPTIREAAQLIMKGGTEHLKINGVSKSLDEWKTNQKEAIAIMKALAKWEI